uniref:Uncharacterized protein n=1 Tax=Anguilla anguilla TaxID=7936 RepID=A0A0E9XRM0_ANGAN
MILRHTAFDTAPHLRMIPAESHTHTHTLPYRSYTQAHQAISFYFIQRKSGVFHRLAFRLYVDINVDSVAEGTEVGVYMCAFFPSLMLKYHTTGMPNCTNDLQHYALNANVLGRSHK